MNNVAIVNQCIGDQNDDNRKLLPWIRRRAPAGRVRPRVAGWPSWLVLALVLRSTGPGSRTAALIPTHATLRGPRVQNRDLPGWPLLLIITCFQFSFICCFWANEKSESNYMRITPSVYVRRVARGRRTYVMFLWSNVMFQDFNSIALPLSLLPVDLNCFIMWTWRIGQCYFRLKSMSLNDKRHTLNVLGKSFNTAGQGFGFLCRSLLPHQ